MKLCVYAICKNELKFLDKWLENMSEADYIVVLDTCSTDGSFEFLQNDKRVTRVEQKEIKPWRFDVARNESMALIPEDTDICICTDPDELFVPGWGAKLRQNWIIGETQRAEYTYAWSHNEQGGPENIYKYNKIHAYGLYHWLYPCHEVLMPIDENMAESVIDFKEDIYLHHYQDKSKDRTGYLGLLKLAADENKGSVYNQMLYARELIIAGRSDDGLAEYAKILDNPDVQLPINHKVWLDSLLQVASEHYRRGEWAEAIDYSLSFIAVDATYREPYLLLADIYNNTYKLFTVAKSYIWAAKTYCYRHVDWIEHSTAYSGWLEQLDDIIEQNLALAQIKEQK